MVAPSNLLICTILNNNNHLCAVFGKAWDLLHNADLEISWEFDHIWYFCDDSDDDSIMLITMAFSPHMLTAQAPYNLSHLEHKFLPLTSSPYGSLDLFSHDTLSVFWSCLSPADRQSDTKSLAEPLGQMEPATMPQIIFLFCLSCFHCSVEYGQMFGNNHPSFAILNLQTIKAIIENHHLFYITTWLSSARLSPVVTARVVITMKITGRSATQDYRW